MSPRRLEMLEVAGLIQSTTIVFGRSRGRLGKLVSLIENGTRLLGYEDHTLSTEGHHGPAQARQSPL